MATHAANGAAAPSQGKPQELEFTGRELSAVRSFVSGRARRNGVERGEAEDVAWAVHELASNSVRHAGGCGVLRAWRSGDVLHWEVRDDGWIRDPLVGTVPPPPEQAAASRGLWLVRQLCGSVSINSSPRGSIIRLRTRLH